ncbi:MAG TPA: ABC transporter permease [Acetivibrio sp.]|uniref:ABC transporter permease n=1 Tax=Acetivibrio sp. TaxID=1872092 RepID=UPI002B6AC7E7|nr:ABC transporter permease [Acetivibrio sp.]HOM03230.1 ABC transporter permease [Acetivibrio sp.]
MATFKAAFINEVEKIYRKKKVVVAAILSLLAIVMGQLVVMGINKGFGLIAASSTQFPILVLSLLVNTILPLFTTLVAIDVFSGEFSHNTMKITLTRPVSRMKLYTAKICAVAFFVLANLVMVMLLSLAVGVVFNAVSLSVSGVFRIILSYIVTLIPVMGFALIVVFLSNVLKSGTTVFFLSIILFIAFNALSLVFPRYTNFFITSMFDWYVLWNVDIIPLGKLMREFLIMAGYVIMFYTAGYYLFDKKDL